MGIRVSVKFRVKPSEQWIGVNDIACLVAAQQLTSIVALIFFFSNLTLTTMSKGEFCSHREETTERSEFIEAKAECLKINVLRDGRESEWEGAWVKNIRQAEQGKRAFTWWGQQGVRRGKATASDHSLHAAIIARLVSTGKSWFSFASRMFSISIELFINNVFDCRLWST